MSRQLGTNKVEEVEKEMQCLFKEKPEMFLRMIKVGIK